MIVVSGPPGSGKSDLAEHLAVSSPFKSRYYIATMKIMDDAGRARAERHRKNRAGKGFITLEIETDIETADTGMEAPFESVVLLECVANLTGNIILERVADKFIVSPMDRANGGNKC